MSLVKVAAAPASVWGAASAGLKVGARGAVASQPSREQVEAVVDTVSLTWL